MSTRWTGKTCTAAEVYFWKIPESIALPGGSNHTNFLLLPIEMLLAQLMCRLFTSGYTADVIARQSVLDAEINFLQKPLSIHTLAKKLHAIFS